MKGIFFIIISFFPILVFSQISVTSANGQNVKDFLETHFLCGGIQISNVQFTG